MAGVSVRCSGSTWTHHVEVVPVCMGVPISVVAMRMGVANVDSSAYTRESEGHVIHAHKRQKL